jgi:hypothetical protein
MYSGKISRIFWNVYSGSDMKWNNIHLILEKGFFFFPGATKNTLIVGKYENGQVAFPSDNSILLSFVGKDGFRFFSKIMKACQVGELICEDVEIGDYKNQTGIQCVKFKVSKENEIWGENQIHAYCRVMEGRGIVEYHGDKKAYSSFKVQLISLAMQMESQYGSSESLM